MRTVYVGETEVVSVPPTRVHDLADWWPLPPSVGGTLTKEQYDRGDRLGQTPAVARVPSEVSGALRTPGGTRGAAGSTKTREGTMPATAAALRLSTRTGVVTDPSTARPLGRVVRVMQWSTRAKRALPRWRYRCHCCPTSSTETFRSMAAGFEGLVAHLDAVAVGTEAPA